MECGVGRGTIGVNKWIGRSVDIRASPIDSLPKEYSLCEHRKRGKTIPRGITSVSPSLALCRTPRDALVS